MTEQKNSRKKKVNVVDEQVEVVQDTVVDNDVQETVVEADKGEKQEEVLSEFVHQLGIFNKFVYHVRDEDAKVIVSNLGYGDVYVSTKDDVRVGNEKQRLLFKEQREFKGVSKLYFLSASQPVVSIIEVK